ncbi:1040_t:CDS:2, partial [Cetraspora pellucida]
ELISNPEILNELEKQLPCDCSKLKSFLDATQIIEKLSPCSKDITISVGEKLSCRISIKGQVNAEFINLGDVIEQ